MAIVVMGTSDQALPALVFFLASYAIANLAAFAVVTYLRGRTALESYQGLARQAPIATTILIASLLSLVGIPPLIGFFGKLMFFQDFPLNNSFIYSNKRKTNPSECFFFSTEFMTLLFDH